MADIIDEDAAVHPPRLTTRAVVVIAYGSINLLTFTGFVVAVHGPTGHIRLALLVAAGACGVGVVGGLIVAGIKLVRDAQTPLWSYVDPMSGRKVHGFFAWWGQCAGLWCLIVVTGYNVMHLVELVADAVTWVG